MRKASVKTRTTLNKSSKEKFRQHKKHICNHYRWRERSAHLSENRTALTSSALRWLHGLIRVCMCVSKITVRCRGWGKSARDGCLYSFIFMCLDGRHPMPITFWKSDKEGMEENGDVVLSYLCQFQCLGQGQLMVPKAWQPAQFKVSV